MDKGKTPYKGSMDKRILKSKILVGELKEKELSGYLKSLPDVAENAKEIEIDMDLRRKGKRKDLPANEPL
ncbi:MAG: hypothetical protein A4E73_00180 [Syntrophaceae bacterium PtaU1.Bin231]|nr:MAG: hypothetical protein A4E73_00180 [Syntrophaceae bacterium PtaU1.Bin231]HOG16608.1 hypothetical protein [Syntrophales bacterium]